MRYCRPLYMVDGAFHAHAVGWQDSVCQRSVQQISCVPHERLCFSVPCLVSITECCTGQATMQGPAAVSGRHKMSKVSQVADAYSNRHSYKAKKAVHGHGGGTSSGSAHTGHASGVRRQRREAATVVSGASKLSIGPSNASRVHLRHLADSGKYGYGGSGRYRLDV